MKTGSEGRPWVHFSGPKPPAVPDHYAYWREAPAELSPRLVWWMDQIARGWRPNRRLRAECADCSASWYGVYLWEYLHVIVPALTADSVGATA